MHSAFSQLAHYDKSQVPAQGLQGNDAHVDSRETGQSITEVSIQLCLTVFRSLHTLIFH